MPSAILLATLLVMRTFLIPQPAHARFDLTGCLSMTQTKMEKIFCNVKAKGKGKHLPDLFEFRQNSLQVQALLLKRPAAAIGLSLPETEKKTPHPKKAEVKKTEDKKEKGGSQTAKATTKATNNNASLKNCTLNQSHIQCPTMAYRFIKNKPNSKLKKSALHESNRLKLNQHKKDTKDTVGLHAYLSESYRLYINKMLEIGLGESTMTFTKFYHTFQHTQANNIRFAERFEEMFQFLKIDKKTMSISTKGPKFYPKTINECAPLSSDIIVCDDGKTNWLYQSI